MFGVKIGLQTKLVFLLLLVSLVSMIAIAVVSYRSGRQALEQNMYDRLTSVREGRKAQILARMAHVRGQMNTLSEDTMVIDAIKEFKAAMTTLPNLLQHDPKILAQAAERDKGLRQFYEKDFLPALKKNLEGKPQLETYLPHDPVTQYLQYHYLAANAHPYGEKQKLDVAEEPSEYSKVHAEYHARFRRLAETFAYDNIMLIDLETSTVLYSVLKTTELGSELLKGPYSSTNFAELVRAMQKQKDPSVVKHASFENYTPNLNRPASFLATPVADGPNLIGLLVFQFPSDSINRVLSGDYNYERDGLGKTGEVVLVSHNHTMRSESRFHHEDPDEYYGTLAAAGYPRDQIDRIHRAGTTILAQEIHSPAVERALSGYTRTEIIKDYRGVSVISSYGPLELGSSRWMIMAKMDEEEAFAPIRQLERNVAITAVTTTLILGVIAIGLSWNLVRPIHRLLEGARKVATGRNDVTVKVNSQDESRELADSFNQMTQRLQEQATQIDRKEQEYQKLLYSILPPLAADRVRQGQQLDRLSQVSDSHADVTVMFAKIVGFTELAESLPADKAITLLNDLVVAFDDAAERFGVEKIKTVGSTYMAACGLAVQRPDHAHRMVEFAQELLHIVRLFVQEHLETTLGNRWTSLGVQIGIHCGPVVGGVVGRTRFLYDLWGETVNLAHNLLQSGESDVIRVTQAVHERLRDLSIFHGPHKIEIPHKGTFTVWTVVPPGTVAIETEIPAVLSVRAS